MIYPEKNDIEKQSGKKGFIRFLHAVPNEPEINVDIIVNGEVVAQNIGYEQFTEYFGAKPGEYIIQVFPAATRLEQLLNIRITIMERKIYTAAIIGTVGNLSLEVFEDMPVAEENDKYCYMRFINISPSGKSFDITIDKTPIVYDLMYTEATDYLQLKPGSHTLKVSTYNDKKQAAFHPKMELKAGNIYTCYIVGLFGSQPEIQVLLPLEGSSYIDTSK